MAVHQRRRGLDLGVRGQGLRRAAAGRPVPDRPASCSPPSTAATYFNKLYAYPSTSDGGLLYYRKDLLDKYGISDAADDLRRDEGRLRQDQGGREQQQARLLRRPVRQVRGPDGELRRGRAQRRRRHRGRRRQAERGDARGGQGPADPGRLVQERRHPQGGHHLAGGERPSGVRGRPADLPPQLGLRVQPGPDRQGQRRQGQVRRRPAAGHHRSGRLEPGRPQLRHRDQRRRTRARRSTS